MAAHLGTRARAAILSAGVSLCALVGGWTWAAARVPGFDSGQESISALAALETPHRWVMTWALVLTGLTYAATAALTPLLRRPGRWALAGAGIATLAVAAVPLPERGASSTAHIIVATASFGLLSLWPFLAARTRTTSTNSANTDPPNTGPPTTDSPPGGAAPGPDPVLLRWHTGLAATTVLALGTVSLATPLWGASFGVGERLVAAACATWPLLVAVDVWWALGHRLGARRPRQVVAALALTLGCAGAGIVATTLAPANVQVGHYRVSVSLSADPRQANELTAETTFGDVGVEFVGLAPGINVTPQVLASITDELNGGGWSLDRLRPDAQALSDGTSTAAVDLTLRFALGAAVLAVAVIGGTAAVRRRRPTRAGVALGLTAALVATLGTLGAVRLTYQSAHQRTYTATELLGTLQRNQGILGDVEARANQATPYLRNLLALASSLQRAYAAPSLEAAPSLRLLAVSDLHDGNAYSLLKAVIQDQSVDAVLDTGDLVSFGTVDEAEAAGMFAGIASLGVPYLFVRGNHDATSATDTALLDRLAKIKNVVLLDPGDGSYREVSLGGVTIAGFNDPRFYGDSGVRTAAAQEPARRAFEAAYAGRPAPDVVASHEPSALDGVTAGILVNGHTHIPDLEGNRIQVGTLTGGGPFSHFIATDPGGGELAGQPSAFDLLTFSPQCRLSSLTRFVYRGVYEGRPTFDDVTLVNGARIDTRKPDPERTCAPAPIRTERIPPAD